MAGKKTEKKTGCYLKHQKDPTNPGELMQAENESGYYFSFRRHYCVFCGKQIEDEIIK